jgi:hypothetical protein
MKNKKVIGGYRWGIKANNDPNGSKLGIWIELIDGC